MSSFRQVIYGEFPESEHGPDTDPAAGTRYSSGKPGGWWYLPLYGLRLMAPVGVGGAEKYAPLDWREGQSYSTLLDCAWRHLLEAMDKGVWSRCPESGELHLGHLAWNVLALLTFMAAGRDDLDDVTPWRGVTAAGRIEAEAEAKVRGVDVLEVLRERREPT